MLMEFFNKGESLMAGPGPVCWPNNWALIVFLILILLVFCVSLGVL